ncbi:hypothetical protein [Mesorhizobium sp. 131-2-1]|uniref:hypothetical protein n=1 Tax=Mesorhizobium sp. 131-2-1 TaxID=2744518 RepID=UPI001927F01F|nr:hypothetical protein [Mesorhizobium sp. 131-2-1]
MPIGHQALVIFSGFCSLACFATRKSFNLLVLSARAAASILIISHAALLVRSIRWSSSEWVFAVIVISFGQGRVTLNK